MNKEDALRDLYDHERDVRTMYLLTFVMLAFGYVLLGLELMVGSAVLFFTGVGVFTILKATSEDGRWRRFYQRLGSGMNGVPLDTKREALSQYHITDESDLEDIE